MWSSFGSTTDLHRIPGGTDPITMVIHTCPPCGYSGYDDAFKRKSLDPALKERVYKEITPLIKEFSVDPEWPYEFAPAERRYEFAAWIAEWQGESAQSIGDLYLRAAWCGHDSNDTEKERFYRLKALEYFRQAMEREEIPHEFVGVYTYLIGELYRRIGEVGAANVWYDQVVEAVKVYPKQQWLVDLAAQQKTNPKEKIGGD